MAFDLSNKFELAVRQYLILQGVAEEGEIFLSNDSSSATLPNRKVLVDSFAPERPHRLEGVVTFQIQHHFAGTVQPGSSDPLVQMEGMAEFKSETEKAFGFTDGDSLNTVADAITQAAHWMATPDASPEGIAFAEKYNFMRNFRCDWVKMSSPYLVRGQAHDSTNWVEVLNFSAFVSHAVLEND